MSGGIACRDKKHRHTWRVLVAYANYSAFNGGNYTQSDYSELNCPVCGARWRTKAKYVEEILGRGDDDDF